MIFVCKLLVSFHLFTHLNNFFFFFQFKAESIGQYRTFSQIIGLHRTVLKIYRILLNNRAHWIPCRRVATCKPDKPGLTSFSETLALFFVQFLSFWKIKVHDRQNSPSKSFQAYQKKLAGYAPGIIAYTAGFF